MEFIRFLRAESDAFNIRLLIAAIFTGLIAGAMIAIVVSAAERPREGLEVMWLLAQFAVCFVFFARSRRRVLERIASIVAEVIGRVRQRLCDRIANAELRQFERVGKTYFYKVLSQDTIVISESATPIINATSSSVVTCFALVCIAVISLKAFLAVAGLITLAIVYFLRRQKIVNQALRRADECEKRFFALLEHLLDGFKEVKISRARHSDLLDNHLHEHGQRTVELKQVAGREAAGLIVFAQGFFYLLIGLMLFVWPALTGEAHADMVRIITLILFIIGPIGEAVGALPAIARAEVAINNLYELEAILGRLESKATSEPQRPETPSARPSHAPPSTGPDVELALALTKGVDFSEFEHLRLRNVSFTYHTDDHFQLGPIDLDVRRGEIVFLVGGNGSGKSTLLKVLTGLYESAHGKLMIDDHEVELHELDHYRSLFSIIFTDFHLFDSLYGMDALDHDRAQTLLERMELAGLTSIDEDGRISRTELSTGQRKRLALLIAELEDRPLLVLDEWAADQDPHFRRFFYRELLPEFARRGTTIIAATHDDHYFDVADRIFKLDRGKLDTYVA